LKLRTTSSFILLWRLFPDWSGKPIIFSPTDPRSKPVRTAIQEKFSKVSKMIVLTGDNTWQSDWVQWEINTIYNMKSQLPGETWKRIRGMKLKDSENAIIPSALMNRRSTMYLN
jgi:hypothetical protein